MDLVQFQRIFVSEMKFILVAVLISLLFAQTFSKWMVVLEYQLNKDFIANALCINKAKPILKCKGKCQVMKKLAEEEQENSSTTNPIKTKVQEVVFSDEVNKPVLHAPASTKKIYNHYSPFSKYSAPVTSIFHPPAIG